MVKLFTLEDAEEIEEVRAHDPQARRVHPQRARRGRCWRLWEAMVPKFVKVYPNDYRRVIETQKRYKAQGLPDDEAVMAAFEENAHDLARVGGK